MPRCDNRLHTRVHRNSDARDRSTSVFTTMQGFKMKRHMTLLLCAASLATGMVWGRHVWPLMGTSSLQARAPRFDRTEELYKELAAESGFVVRASDHLTKVATLTTPSVVHLQSQRQMRGRQIEETGSGIIMSSPTKAGVFVVSNRHVVNGSRPEDISIRLSAPDGRVLRPTKIWMDKDTDVAILQVNAAGLQAGKWGDSDRLKIGHMVLALGSPFGLSQSVTFGIVSAKGRRSLRLGSGSDVLNQDFIQTDAAINPGNSGGPLIDMHGRVIGINTAIASSSGGNEGIGFSIPSNLVRKVMNELLTYGRVRRAYLGVKLDSQFDAETAARFRLDRARGARVVEVYANTPASKADIDIDDIILTFDGIRVEDENHLINLVSLTDLNRTVSLKILRDGREITVRVQLGDRSDLERRS